MEVDKNWLESILIKCSNDQQVKKIISLEASSAVGKGENYASNMIRVKLTVMLGSGKMANKSVIIKEVPETELRRQQLTEFGIFFREILMYRDILPMMEALKEEIGDKTEMIWGQMLYHTPYEKLVFEDLSDSGYKMGNRLEGLDLAHCLLAVRNLAKFHALSVMLQERQQIPMIVFDQHIALKRKDLIEMFNGASMNNFIESIEKYWGSEWIQIRQKLKQSTSSLVDYYISRITRDGTKFCVLSHGDCWLNNMLFKYDEDLKTPISLKFVDFQVSYLNSPAVDLQHFYSTSLSYEVRENHLNTLTEAYHMNLVNEMKKLNCTTEPLSLEVLNTEMDRYAFFGIMTAASVLPMLLVDKAEDVLDLEKVIGHMEDNNMENVSQNMVPTNNERFIKIMKLLLKRADDQGLLD